MYSSLKYYLSFFLAFATPLSSQTPFVNAGFSSMHPEKSEYNSPSEQAFFTSTASRWFNVTYYRLALNIEITTAYVTGQVTIAGTCSSSSADPLTFDLNNVMQVDSVHLNGAGTTFTRSGASLQITHLNPLQTGEEIKAEIFYQGTPVGSGFGSYYFSKHDNTPWIWTLSEPAGARDWWPCKDDPSDKADSADILITCDSTMKAGSEGKLISTTYAGNGKVTYHWHEEYPIASYLISIAITNFREYTNYFRYTNTDSMPILNYLLPEHYDAYVSALARVPDMLAIYSDLFGMYPFIKEKYGHAEYGSGGGMEHQTMTSLALFTDDAISHELAHQWFGDMITCRTWNDLWLNEGFAEYCTALYREKEFGTQSYSEYMGDQFSPAYGAVGEIATADTTNIGKLFNGARMYNKGAVVLHMLRHVLGDSIFFSCMKAYATNTTLQYNTASIADFQSVCEATSGGKLDWFFNEWIYGSGYPVYSFWWTNIAAGDSTRLTLEVRQGEQSNPEYFTMPVDIHIVGRNSDTTISVWNNGGFTTYTFTLKDKPVNVEIDPDQWILKQAYDYTKAPPTGYDLAQNYPNPFNGFTTIEYKLPTRSSVSIKIFDLLGREVATLVNKPEYAGKYSVQWNAASAASGIYFCRIQTEKFSSVRKMILLR
jgi:aminopeptidase N